MFGTLMLQEPHKLAMAHPLQHLPYLQLQLIMFKQRLAKRIQH